MAITVEPEGLRGDAQRLAGSQAPGAAPVCEAPARDMVSTAATDQLTARSQALAVLLDHAASVRAHGGAVLASTAAGLQDADDENAAALRKLVAGGGAATGGMPTGVVGAAPAPPTLPDIPVMPPLPPLTGEAYAEALHTGPGAGSLRQFAREWRQRGAAMEQLAAEIRQVAAAIEQHWVDGHHRAGVNTHEHAAWLDDAGGAARGLAAAADELADSFELAKARTPTPQEFARARQRWRQAVARNVASGGLNMAEVADASADYAGKQAATTKEAGVYAAAAVVVTSDPDKRPPMSPAPPIATADDAVRRPFPSIEAEEIKNKPAPGDEEGEGGVSTDTGAHGKADPADGRTAETHPPGFASKPAPPDAASMVDAEAAGSAGNAAGAATGSALGALSQLAGAMPGSGGGMPSLPMSGLPSIPGLGGMPSMPGGPGGDPGVPKPDSGVDGEIPDTTLPAGGGGGGEGVGGGLPPMSGPLPATTAGGPAAVAPAVPTAAASAAPASPAMGAMGMYPPMMGHGGRGNDSDERDKRLYPDRRVVIREVPNTEPVFGELPQEPRRRPNRVKEEEA